MIEPALASAFERIGAAQRDALHGYEPGFEPEMRANAQPTAPQPSADPLSSVAPEGAFFVTAGPAGDLRYTRDGGFAVSAGALRARDGSPVFGFAPGSSDRIVPLRADAFDVALGRLSAPRIEADGTFAYERSALDPRTGDRRVERVVAGRVALARFAAGTQLERIDATHLGAPAGISPRFGTPGSAAFGQLIPHARDAGRLDPIAGLEAMREAFEAFDALRAANHARGTLDHTAMDLLK